MDSNLKKAIEASTLLSPKMRESLLKAVEKGLSPEQTQKIMTLLKDAETKKTAVLAKAEDKKKEANKKYLKRLDEFVKHDIPKMRRAMEEKIRVGEKAEAEKLISTID